MKNSCFILPLILLLSCKNAPEPIPYEAKGNIVGEWRYVSQSIDGITNFCLECLDYEVITDIVRLNADATLSCRIGALIIEGSYESQEISNAFNPQVYRDLFLAKGTFKTKTFVVLNKPPQTEVQGRLMEAIKATNRYQLYTNIESSLQSYDQLRLYFSGEKYLLLLRKKRL